MADRTEPVVGRARELAALDAVLDGLDVGEGRFVAITGEPGIGKSRLLAELAARADARDALVLEGAAAEFERDLPFGVLVDALELYLVGLEPERRSRVGADDVEVTAVFPRLRSDGDGGRVTSSAERYLSYHAVRELLERLGGDHPLVIVLDDMHWADEGADELVAHLIRRPPPPGVLLAVGFRSGRASPTLEAGLEDAEKAGTLDRLELGPLTPAEAEPLLADCEAPVREQLYRESGGNPFYLTQLRRRPVGSAGAIGAGAGAGPADVDVPAAVSAALRAELAELSPGARHLLEGAAVVGDPFAVDLGAEAAGIAEAEALAALDELTDADLVRTTEIPRRFRFRHPLVRGAVYGAIKPGRRLGAHGRVAQALAERSAPAAMRAHHLEQSAREGDEEAIAVLAEAGGEAAARAPAAAARWFGAALRLLPEADEGAQRLGLLVALAQTQAATGDLDESRASLVGVLGELPADAGGLRARVVGACAGVEHLLGRHAEAHGRLIAELSEQRDVGSAEAVALEIELALDGRYAGHFEETSRWAAQALEGADALDDRPLQAMAATVVAFAHYLAARIGEARAAVAEAAARVDALDDGELAARIDVAQHLGWTEYDLDHYDDALRHLDRGVAVARATGQGQFLVYLLLGRTMALLATGRVAEARANAETAVEVARLAGDQALSWALWEECWAGFAAGDLEAALRSGEASVALGDQLDPSVLSVFPHCVLAVACLESGDVDRCLAEMEAAGAPELAMIEPTRRTYFYELLANAELARGDVEAAAAWVDYAERTAPAELRVIASAARRARAAVLLAQGDAPAAAELALDAAATFAQAGARIDAARARTLAGRALVQTGERERALEEFENAHAELEACGSERWRDEVAQDLRGIGQAVHRRSAAGSRDGDGLAALTGREREIAALVTDRRTNGEIAAELFLSKKTVETHLRNVFAKLGVSSRVDVARAVERDREAHES